MVGSVVSPGPTIKMLDLGDDHPVRKLLHAAWWYAAIPWHLWIGVSTIPRAKNLLCRSVSGINHHYEPGPMNPPLWPSTSKLFLFHDSPDEIKDWETPSASAKTKTQRKKVQIVSLKSEFQISFCFCHIMKMKKGKKSGGWQNHYLVWYGWWRERILFSHAPTSHECYDEIGTLAICREMKTIIVAGHLARYISI